MGLRKQGKRLALEGGVAGDGVQGGTLMQSKARFVLTSARIRECLDYGPLVGCVSLMFVLLTQTQHPMMEDTHKNPVSERAAQKGKMY